MTTMTPPTATPPPPGTPPPGSPPPARRVQRSTSDRVAGGVAGGLGEYFGLDPILFRVLFAVAAFFGGFGLIAYALLWLALPEAGDPATTSVDRLGVWLARRGVPLWAAIVVGVLAFWLVFGGFSGWAFHGIFFPGAAVVGVALLAVTLSRRGKRRQQPPTGFGPVTAPPADTRTDVTGDPTISLHKDPAPAGYPDPYGPAPQIATDPAPGPAPDPAPRPMAAWYREARDAGRRRRRRARPIALGTLAAVAVGLGTVAVVDAVSGVAIPVYAIVGGSIVVAGALVGAVLRRPAYSLLWLLIPALAWLAAFGGTHVSLRDGAGDDLVRPATAAGLHDNYQQAFGRFTLDLRSVYTGAPSTSGAPTTVTVRVAAGVARVIVPTDADVTVRSEVRTGSVRVDGSTAPEAGGGTGWRLVTTVPPGGTSGPQLTVVLQVTDGTASVEHG